MFRNGYRALFASLAALFVMAWLPTPGIAASTVPSSIFDFNNVPINASVTEPIEVTIDNGFQLETASGGPAANPFSFAWGSCRNLSGAGTCTAYETFTPQVLGPVEYVLSLQECNGNATTCQFVSIEFIGNGVEPGGGINPSSFDFGNVPLTTAASEPIGITVDSGYMFEGWNEEALIPPFSLDPGGCVGFIGPGTCSAKVTFAPTWVGTTSGFLDVQECLQGGTLVCLYAAANFSGGGLSVAAVSPSSMDFGSVPINTTAGERISVTFDSGYSFMGDTGNGANAPFSISPGTCALFTGPGTCTIDDYFSPTAVGAATGQLELFECLPGAAHCVTLSLSLAGTGISVAAANPGVFDFGNVPLNTTVSAPITLTFDSGYSLEGDTEIGATSLYSFSPGTCGLFNGPGTCVASAYFSPTYLGTTTAELAVYECEPGAVNCVALGIILKGNGVQVPTATVLSTSVNPPVVGQPVIYTATVNPTPSSGTVSFFNNGTPISNCAAVPVSEAGATCMLAYSSEGARNITATFSGTATFTSSASDVLTEVVTGTPCATLAACNLTGTTLINASLTNANLAGSNLNSADLSRANLTRANMGGANLNGAILNGADLRGADLAGANAVAANFTGANLQGATTTGANFNRATWANTTCPDGTNSDRNGGTCGGHL